jgi:hypothetical protein
MTQLSPAQAVALLGFLRLIAYSLFPYSIAGAPSSNGAQTHQEIDHE